VERTIPRLVDAAAEKFGQHSAIEEGDLRLDFVQLAAEGIRAARAFGAAGVQPGDRVAI
jgi:non-ribosomal peptide synthetase component F